MQSVSDDDVRKRLLEKARLIAVNHNEWIHNIYR